MLNDFDLAKVVKAAKARTSLLFHLRIDRIIFIHS